MAFLGNFISGGLTSAFANSSRNTLNTAQGSTLPQLTTAEALADKEMQFNSMEAQKNRQFQAEMSNTAYQRAVEDLKRAGLNPYLAYEQGGTSTPTGSTASYSGFAPSVMSALISNLNTTIKSQSAREVALINGFTNLLGKASSRK